MTKSFTIVLAGLALTLAFVFPAQAQDVAKEGEAASTEMMKSHTEMMGESESCQCPCMQEMREKMMEMHGNAEGMDHDADGAHAEGMDSDEGHAEMMAAHKEMMAGCQCMSGEGEEAMSCKMHGGMGEMGEGMQHRHGMEGDADSEAETEAEG
jgi:hypothetical protein